MRDEMNPDYLSACVMKYLWRGELDRARYYLEPLTELQAKKSAPEGAGSQDVVPLGVARVYVASGAL